MKQTVMTTLLLLAPAALLVSCIDPARLADKHDIEYAPRLVIGSRPATNTILLKSEKALLLAALSKATTRSYTPCDCFPSCSFTFVGTGHSLHLHGSSTLKLDTTREYNCNSEELQKLLKLIEDRSNHTSDGIRQPADGSPKPSM
jgi:hypothetical protein